MDYVEDVRDREIYMHDLAVKRSLQEKIKKAKKRRSKRPSRGSISHTLRQVAGATFVERCRGGSESDGW